jgi:ATP-binding cassette, subfamily B, bacterial PglK
MKKKSNSISLWNHLTRRRQKQFYLLLLLMILASLAEVISVGAVLPFLGILTAPEQLYQHSLMQPIIQQFQLTSPQELLLPFTLIFITAALLAGVIRLLLLYAMTRFSYAAGADLSIDIYRRTLYQEYAVHMARNSSEVINGIINKTNTVITGVITPALTLISSVVFIMAILSTLFVIDTTVALIASIGFGGLYWMVIRYTRQRLQENSQCIANQSTQMIKSLQEGLGGIRDVLIDGSQQFYCQLYRNADLPLRKASGDNVFIGSSPRFVMEAVGMVLIAVLAYTMSLREDGLMTVVPVLGALALGAQRLLPALQQAYSSYSLIKGSQSSFQDVINLLKQPLPEYTGQPLQDLAVFEKEIQLTNLSFSYSKKIPRILDKINLTINKGACIGFIGKTGSGKSTLLDVIMGLLSSTSGGLFIDGQLITVKNLRSWQLHIAHVPQSIYLSDSSIAENIAFGISPDKIDYNRVQKAANQAQIAELINDWPEGYQTFVGEQGVRLSGGQRQRIGIARALYKKANVLIFDEATSALDSGTEQAVMEAIKGLEGGLTILIIAHRLSTLKDCDSIIRLDENNIIHTTSYAEIVNEK